MKNFNLIISGIGGQGVLTLAGVIGEAILQSGYDVKLAELHGLAQRFGPLSTHIRFGKDIHSPLVKEGGADLILGLERLEVLHALRYAGKQTSILMDTKESVPTVLYRKKIKYPEIKEVITKVKSFTKDITPVDATRKVILAGAPPVTANIYLMGTAIARGLLPIKENKIISAMKATVPPKFLDMNKRVFRLGIKD
jgi:indolepyruvate ferredoxin oxidoreductase beta subunit